MSAVAELDFAAVEPGRLYGESLLCVEPALVERWLAIYGAKRTGDLMPRGMMPVVTIRAYMAVLPVRPAGGVHAAQSYAVVQMPRLGQWLRTTVTCVSKTRKAERLWVALETVTRGPMDELLFTGAHKALWAR